MSSKANIVEVPVSENSDIKWFVDFFEKKKIYKNQDTELRLKTEFGKSAMMLNGLLLIIGMALLTLERKGKYRTHIKSGASSIRDFHRKLSKSLHRSSIEKLLERRYHLNIHIDHQATSSSTNYMIEESGATYELMHPTKKDIEYDLNDIFGIWKGKKVSLNKIREEQWERKR